MLIYFQAEKIINFSCQKLHYLLRNCNFLRNSDFQLPFLFEINKLTLIFLTFCKALYSLTSVHEDYL